MSDPVTYTFYGTTVPVLKAQATSAISILTAAQAELKANPTSFPSEQELLDASFNDMLPLRVQPILATKFPLNGITSLSLSSAAAPALNPGFADFAAVIAFFEQMVAVYDGVDAEKWNASAAAPLDVNIEAVGKVLHMRGFADHVHSFVVPNSYFHLNAMYMLLRSKGFKLGKGMYVGAFMSKTQGEDWAPLRG